MALRCGDPAWDSSKVGRMQLKKSSGSLPGGAFSLPPPCGCRHGRSAFERGRARARRFAKNSPRDSLAQK